MGDVKVNRFCLKSFSPHSDFQIRHARGTNDGARAFSPFQEVTRSGPGMTRSLHTNVPTLSHFSEGGLLQPSVTTRRSIHTCGDVTEKRSSGDS